MSVLDGKPAAALLEELKGRGLFPLERPIFGLPCGADYSLITALQSEKPAEPAVRFNRKLYVGDKLYLMAGTAQDMVNAGGVLFRSACEDTHALSENWRLIMAFSCTGRYQRFNEGHVNWNQVIEQLRKDYPGVHVVGGLCAGEFGVDKWHRARANSMSVSVCAVTDKHATRGLTRELQRRLLRAAEDLSRHETTKAVMTAALHYATEAGAKGGQICLVDKKLKRIIGKDLGYAFNHPESPYNWRAVAELTDRKAPKEVGGDFPGYLVPWSLPVEKEVPIRVVASPKWSEDLLPFIVRTRQAIFIPDSRDTRFLCNQKAVRAGNLMTQMAIPLIGSKQIGSNREVIATFQVSFRDGRILDQESFGLWVGFAQKLAVVLERAQEADERAIMENITAIVDKITQMPIELVPEKHQQYAWCETYLARIINLLGADGAHLRRFFEGSEADEYHLISAAGHLKPYLEKSRQTIRDGEGHKTLKLLERHPPTADGKEGGIVENTPEAIAELYKDVQPCDGDGEMGKALAKEIKKIKATALLPLETHGEVFGSFTITSKRENFFTERWERLARMAARQAGSLLLGKNAEYERELLDAERRWMLQILSSATEGHADERLRSLMTLVTDAIGANIGTVFIWHKTVKKLILHIAHNWDTVEVEGVANYVRGEGWTGSLIDKGDLIRIVKPGAPDALKCTKKYFENYREHVSDSVDSDSEERTDARLGIRLGDNEEPLGVVTFLYDTKKAEQLVKDDGSIPSRLEALAPLMTLGVEAARQEIAQALTLQLNECKDEVWKRLIHAAEAGESWQPVVDATRIGFDVERVSLYLLSDDNKLLRHECMSKGGEFGPQTDTPIAPAGILGEIVTGNLNEYLADESDKIPSYWPNPGDIKTLYAVPVMCSGTDIVGILEFVNRNASREHPYDILNEVERRHARDVARWFGSAIDHRKHEIAEKESQDRLITARRISGAAVVSAVMMHRLMAPFGRIQIAVDNLKDPQECSEEERLKFLNRIENNCSTCVDIIRQITASEAVGVQQANIQKLVDLAVQAVKREVPLASGIHIDVVNSLNVFVMVDIYAIVGSLVDLLSNALDALRGGGALTVSTQLSPDKKNVIIRIHNTGRHYEEQEIALFKSPGYSSKEGEPHLGLGFSIAKQAVEAAGGTIKMQSPQEGGIEVLVVLPLMLEAGKGASAAKEI
ncbi:MAG: ATP-binding protein [Candidatus Hydrogenedentes bacterium]|nr:ATP-binding protein [Candidatus Hydrogenedentota bacterium]